MRHTATALRAGAVTTAAAGLLLAAAGPAFAHVTAQPGSAPKGSESVVAIRVPDESDTAGTIAVKITLPTDHPITSVATTPVPGWTVATTTIPLNPPAQDDGRTITETVGTVTWTATPGNRIAPGQFLDFPLSLGPLPDDVGQLMLPATQTYDDGQVVNWNEPMGADGSEPEHPAPVVQLIDQAAQADDADPSAAAAAPGPPPAAAPAPPADTSDTTARWLGGLGLLAGALGLGVGTGALVRSRSSRRAD